MFVGCREGIEGRREGRREGFIGRRRRKRQAHLNYVRPAIGSLQLLHYHHAHSLEQIAVFGSFVQQCRGVLTNRKRRLLGRAAASGRPRRRNSVILLLSSLQRPSILASQTRE
jgi:hypothetical protein